MPVEHRLKTLPDYYEAVKRGDKTFEVRRDDRGFQKGDVLVLEKYKIGLGYMKEGENWARIRKVITYVLTGGQFGIEPGHVVLGLADEHAP